MSSPTTPKTSEEKNLRHILLSLVSFALMVGLERLVGRLPIPMWAHGVMGILSSLAAYGTYRWAARKWVGPSQPFIWVLTIIGAGLVMTLQEGLRAELLGMTTITLSVYWKDVVVAYLVEWFLTPKTQRYARRWEFFSLGSTGSLLFGLLAVNVILYDTLIAHVGSNAMLIGVLLYGVFGGWSLLNAHSGIRDEKCDQPLGTYYVGATKVTRYVKLTGVPAAEFGVDSYGWILACGMLFFYLWRFLFL